MSSKPLKQNLGAVTGRRVIRHPADEAALRRKERGQAMEEVNKKEDQIKNLQGEVSVRDNEILHHKKLYENAQLELAMLRREIEKLRKKLEKTTGDVTKEDLQLRNKPSVAKKLPRN